VTEGIDVSKYQATTPSLAGLSFLFAKATEGTTRDPRYAMHVANARKAGLVVGAYHFNYGPGPIAAQVAAFLAAAGDVDLYAVDVEGGNAFSHAQTGAFIKGVQAAGKQCGLYHSESGFFDAGQDWNWVANWNHVPAVHWTFWQYRGSPLDLDRFNGSPDELRAFTAPMEAPMVDFILLPGPAGHLVLKGTGHYYLRLVDGTLHPITSATSLGTKRAIPVRLVKPIAGGSGDRATGYLIGDQAAFLLATDVSFTADAVADPVAEKAAIKTAVNTALDKVRANATAGVSTAIATAVDGARPA